MGGRQVLKIWRSAGPEQLDVAAAAVCLHGSACTTPATHLSIMVFNASCPAELGVRVEFRFNCELTGDSTPL